MGKNRTGKRNLFAIANSISHSMRILPIFGRPTAGTCYYALMQSRSTSHSRENRRHTESENAYPHGRSDRAGETRTGGARGGSVRSSSRIGASARYGDGRRKCSADERGARASHPDVGCCSHGTERHRNRESLHEEGRSSVGARADCSSSRSSDVRREVRSSSRRADARMRASRERETYVGGGSDRIGARRNQGLGSSWAADRAASSSWPFATFMPVLGVLAVVLVAVFLVGAISSCSASRNSAVQEEEQQAAPVAISFNPSVQSIDGVSDPGTTVQGISLADADASYAPQLSDEGSAEVQDAISAITSDGKTVGFALVDLETGSGYAYNLDQRVYGASSFKGPVLIYGCQEALETGKTTISKVNANAQEAIIDSDNKSYYRMRNAFEGSATESLSAWLSSMGISTTLESDTSFPHYSARESLKLWMNAYLYLNSSDSNREITQWAKQLLSSTAVSMVRNGVDPNSNPLSQDKVHSVAEELKGTVLGKLKTTEVGTAKNAQTSSNGSITVYDKAGWINGTEDDAVCDAGIIEENGKHYLITIMTNLADSDSSRTKVSNLAGALWNQRSTLMPEQGYTQA